MRKKICIIEDDKDFLYLLKVRLNSRGYHNIFSESDGLNGFKLIKKIVPHIIILDIGLPSINGIELCKELRKIDLFQQTPIIAYTGKNCTLSELINVGFNDFVQKTSDFNVLLKIIKKWLKKNLPIVNDIEDSLIK